MKSKRYAVVVAILLLLVIGCGLKKTASIPTPLAPGFVNQYDQNTFNALVTAQAAISKAKEDFAANPSAKRPLNAAIGSYNDARAGYLTWHAAAVAESSTDHSTEDNLLAIMLGAIAAVNQQFGVGKPALAGGK